MGVKIILDSSTDTAVGIKDRFSVVPLPVFFGEERYIDGVNLTHAEFYKKLATYPELPKTSQATPFDYTEAYKKAIAAGDDVLVLTISQKLSGTYQSAVIAAQEFPDKVFVVDTETVTIAAGVLAEYALQLADSGMSIGELVSTIEREKKNVRLVAMVDTLEYLKKGGRISKTVAFAGELLNFKPVVAVEDGEVKMLGKARGAKQGNNLLELEIEKAGGVDFGRPVLLGYSGTESATLHRYIDDFSKLWIGHTDDLNISEIGSVVGTHAGPGAIAAAFFANKLGG